MSAQIEDIHEAEKKLEEKSKQEGTEECYEQGVPFDHP
jgi:hypothetical protein